MRLEATISDPRHEQLQHLAEELRVTKSQVIDEALALFQKAVMEVRKGHRVAIIEAESQRPVCEMASPSLTQIEWTAHRQKLRLSGTEAARLSAAEESPARPTKALEQGFARRKQAKPIK